MTGVPEECRLPMAERPRRAAAFDELFTTALLRHERPEATLLRLTLDGSARVEAVTRELVALETACCAVFDFELTRTPEDSLQLDVRVPAGRPEALEGLAARAAVAVGVTA